jgi:hypothetical protein
MKISHTNVSFSGNKKGNVFFGAAHYPPNICENEDEIVVDAFP